MNLNAEQQHFVNHLRNGRGRLHELRMHAQSLPRGERAAALLHLFTDSTDFGHQQIAGRLLVDLKPRCPFALDDVLLSIAGNWNVSVEELAFYLADVFGPVNVSDAALSASRNFQLDDRRHRALGTIAWWLQRRVAESSG
ncbi:MAG: hypothetical protein AAGG48_32275 [Planctomycetota bacterium]